MTQITPEQPHGAHLPDEAGVRRRRGAAGDDLIVLEGVNKHFGDFHALRQIDLRIPRGQVAIVLGPSGSGKSTLCRTINRLETIDDDGGRILVDGRPLPTEGRQLAQLRAEIGMVFQSFNLFAHKSILENVTLGPIKVKGKRRADAERHAMELLERVGVAAQARKMPAQLSGGQQQRVAIARALAMEPKALLFDEPTSALDPETVGEVLAVMRDLAEAGWTMVVVTHEIRFARQVADEVLFIDGGVVVERGAPEQVILDPQAERTRSFLQRILDPL